MSEYSLESDVFRFVASEEPTPDPVRLPGRGELRRALYAGFRYASTGHASLDGYADMKPESEAGLDRLVDGVRGWLAREIGEAG